MARHWLAAGILVAVVACETDVVAPPLDDGDAVVTLSLNELRLALDDASQVGVTRTSLDGRPLPAPIKWRSGNRAIATVDSSGRVTAVGAGTTWIEASDTRHTDTLYITTVIRFSSIHAGQDVTCGLSTRGRALCWGANSFGAVGDGSGLDRFRPVLVTGDRRYGGMSVGAGSVCAESNGLYCWGYNGVGQLGDGTTVPRAQPARIADTLSFVGVQLGAGTTTCALGLVAAARGLDEAPMSNLLCWGWNGFGQLLDGGGVNSRRPKVMNVGRPIHAVAPGGHHVCGLDSASLVWCWGRNDAGQLGDGTTTHRLAPVASAAGHSFASLVSGVAHTCGLDASGRAWCWGENGAGQLGAGMGSASPIPVAVAGGQAFDVLASSSSHTCALAGTSVFCWGDNSGGQLGTGTTSSTGLPVAVAGGLAFVTISTGRNHTCGIADDGLAYCWGDNSRGQLGRSSGTDPLVPGRVIGQE